MGRFVSDVHSPKYRAPEALRILHKRLNRLQRNPETLNLESLHPQNRISTQINPTLCLTTAKAMLDDFKGSQTHGVCNSAVDVVLKHHLPRRQPLGTLLLLLSILKSVHSSDKIQD